MSEDLRMVFLVATYLCIFASIAGWFYGDIHKRWMPWEIDSHLKAILIAALPLSFIFIFTMRATGHFLRIAEFFGYSEIVVALGIVFMGPILGFCHWVAAVVSRWYHRP